ncbi:MAG TPA: hypothetical protein DGR97_09610 [Gammaproteobacteria bacterium]|nr:hypothetical protein [Gammaproteobacteria bacterium]|tara:strand:- start:163 stop:693 length:531 start_codon:yes stop_codon:yes gene_type:complete
MGRLATINKTDVINARDYLRSTGKAHGIIAIRKYIGHGSPELIGRLLKGKDATDTPGFLPKRASPTVTEACAAKRYLLDALSSREKEVEHMRQAITQLEERVTAAETKCAVMTDLIRAKELEVLRQREIFENWKSDLQQERGPPKADTVKPSRVDSPVTPKSYRGAQLDLYKTNKE